MAILLGDIGGTHARFCWMDKVLNYKMVVYDCDDFSSPYKLLDDIISKSGESVTGIYLSVAGPVDKGYIKWTNRVGWALSEREIQKKYHIKNVRLVNDMVAQGYGLNLGGTKTSLLMNIGTGMGCSLIMDGKIHPCEFGLVLDETHHKKEFLLSGSGVVHFYHLHGGDKKIHSAKKIDELRLKGHDKIAQCAYTDFYRLWGKTAGNLATGLLATGGVYLWGGLVPKIPRDMRDFMAEFHHHKYPEFNKKIPVKIVSSKSLAIKGLAILSKCEYGQS